MASESGGFFGLVDGWDVEGVCVGVAHCRGVGRDTEGESGGGFVP